MIDFLSGVHRRIHPAGVVIDVAGVGYGVETPLSTLSQMPSVGSPVTLWIYTHVREDAIRLFGFLSYEEKRVFKLLLGFNGVGPKVALAMISTLGVSGIQRAASLELPEDLELVPGIGKRLAEKILLELRGKLGKITESEAFLEGAFQLEKVEQPASSESHSSIHLEDLKSALSNLGFKGKTITPIVDKLRQQEPEADFQVLIKKALQELTRNQGGQSQPPLDQIF